MGRNANKIDKVNSVDNLSKISFMNVITGNVVRLLVKFKYNKAYVGYAEDGIIKKRPISCSLARFEVTINEFTQEEKPM